MIHGSTFFGEVDIYDDVFTKDVVLDWQQYLLDCSSDIIDNLDKLIDPDNGIEFFISDALLKEVTYDAVIGLRKITDSKFTEIKSPNAFKIAAYLGYWWLRHKPISLHYPKMDLDDLKVVDCGNSSEDERYRKDLVWRLNHINEIVAVQIVLAYVFNFDNVICDASVCSRVFDDDPNFTFSSFNEMRSELTGKLTYYFAYRAVAPKVIEHFLEAYSFHPAWTLTGPHWAGDEYQSEV